MKPTWSGETVGNAVQPTSVDAQLIDLERACSAAPSASLSSAAPAPVFSTTYSPTGFPRSWFPGTPAPPTAPSAAFSRSPAAFPSTATPALASNVRRPASHAYFQAFSAPRRRRHQHVVAIAIVLLLRIPLQE